MSVEPEIEFSVAIVTYNNENEISQCLKSLLLELQKVTCQIVIVDNNSKDRTKEIIKQKYLRAKKYQRKLFSIENRTNSGFTKALNQALKKCTGRYILVLNPDTVLNTGSPATLKKALQANTKVGVVAPQLLNSDGTIQPSCRRFPRYRDVLFHVTGLSYLFRNSRIFNGWKMGDFNHSERRLVDQPQGACLLFRRKVLETVGFWNERFPMFFSDVDWCQRVKNHGWEIWFEPEAKVMHHRGVSILQTRPNMIWSSHLSFYHYFRKYNADFRYFFINGIVGAILILTAIIRIVWAYITTRILKRIR